MQEFCNNASLYDFNNNSDSFDKFLGFTLLVNVSINSELMLLLLLSLSMLETPALEDGDDDTDDESNTDVSESAEVSNSGMEFTTSSLVTPPLGIMLFMLDI